MGEGGFQQRKKTTVWEVWIFSETTYFSTNIYFSNNKLHKLPFSPYRPSKCINIIFFQSDPWYIYYKWTTPHLRVASLAILLKLALSRIWRPSRAKSWSVTSPFLIIDKETYHNIISEGQIKPLQCIGGLQPFSRDSNDKDPGGHVGWQEQ